LAAAPLLVAAVIGLAGCASADEVAVNKEAGFFYGFGSAKLEADAQAAAMDDLIYNTLTETGSIWKDKKSKVAITAEMRAAFAVFKLKPNLTEQNKDKSYNVVYRLEAKVWNKAESLRLAGLRTDLGGRYQKVKADVALPVEVRLTELAAIWTATVRAGTTLSLAESEGSATPLSQAVETFARELTDKLVFKAQPDTGLLAGGQAVKATVSDRSGKPMPGLTVAVVWNNGKYSLPAVKAKTDALGVLSLAYPTDDTFRNRKASLSVSTVFAVLAPELPWMAALDTANKASWSYRNAEELGKSGANEVLVAGGSFTTGAVKQDRRASRNEAPRQVTVRAFYIDKYLVTNAQYLSYLEATNAPAAAWPDFIEDEAYNQPDQPVIGVSLEDARKYAAWLSGVLGYAKRLPTEDEYEIAARAGQASIYPWGDQAPTDGVRANYSGNKRFNATSPVGSFENGKNLLGLYDMVGNVWEWTTSLPGPNMSADEGTVVVKGGSWMDGPNELRVSARRAVKPGEAASDIGFRLVREAANE
jgi:formylglycine-generating enzyme required for sulfatase activity